MAFDQSTPKYVTVLDGSQVPYWDWGADGSAPASGISESLVWNGQSSARQTILCYYGDRLKLMYYLFGGFQQLSGGLVNVVFPQSYGLAESPASYGPYPWLYVHQIDVQQQAAFPSEGISGQSYGSGYQKPNLFDDPTYGIGVTKFAKLHIIYKSIDYIQNDAGSLNLETAAEQIAPPMFTYIGSGNIPNYLSGYYWGSGLGDVLYGGGGSGQIPLNMFPPQTYTVVTMNKTWVNLSAIPMSQIIAISDCVNSATFCGIPAGYLLYQSSSSVQRQAAWGSFLEGQSFIPPQQLWNLTVRFKYRKVAPWNYIWRPDQATWVQTVPSWFQSIDFNGIFPPITQPFT